MRFMKGCRGAGRRSGKPPVLYGVEQIAVQLTGLTAAVGNERIAQFEGPLRPEHHHRILDEILFEGEIGRAAPFRQGSIAVQLGRRL